MTLVQPTLHLASICGQLHPKTRFKRVVGGSNIDIADSPWSALFNMGNRRKPYQGQCSATILSENFLLTAAHCFAKADEQFSRVFAGITVVDRFNLEQIDDYNIFQVSKFIQSPDYSPKTGNNDIGLINIFEKMNFNEFLSPVCLPKTGSKLLITGDVLRMNGWGATRCNKRQKCTGFSRSLKEVEVPVHDSEKCMWKYMFYRIDLDSQICVGDGVSGRDGCDGDSGAGLYHEIDGKSFVYAVHSWSRTCGKLGFPSVNVRVIPHVDWIESVVFSE